MSWSSSCTRPTWVMSGGMHLREERTGYILNFLIPLILIFVASGARAQTSIAQMDSVEPVEISKKYSFSIGAEYQTNLRKNSSPDQDNSTSMSFVGDYKIRPKTIINAEIDVIKSHSSEGSTELSNLALAVVPTQYEISKELTFKPMIYAILPTNEKARDDQTFNGAVMLRPVLQYKPANLRGLTLSNSIYLGKNFHTYEVQRNYAPNTEYSIRYRFDVGYELLKKLSVGGRVDYARAITYKGVSKDAFYFMQYLGYEINRSWSTYVAHENQGSVRGPNNFGSNIDVFDEKSSYVSLGVQHIF